MSQLSKPLLPARFLFRFSVPCRYLPDGAELGESYRLPNFTPLDGGPEGPEVRAGWNESGLSLRLHLTGKRHLPWRRENRMKKATARTADRHPRYANIHRAGVLPLFRVLPTGGGHRLDDPVADQLLINRARKRLDLSVLNARARRAKAA
jgi:hypothetical protein